MVQSDKLAKDRERRIKKLFGVLGNGSCIKLYEAIAISQLALLRVMTGSRN